MRPLMPYLTDWDVAWRFSLRTGNAGMARRNRLLSSSRRLQKSGVGGAGADHIASCAAVSGRYFGREINACDAMRTLALHEAMCACADASHAEDQDTAVARGDMRLFREGPRVPGYHQLRTKLFIEPRREAINPENIQHGGSVPPQTLNRTSAEARYAIHAIGLMHFEQARQQRGTDWRSVRVGTGQGSGPADIAQRLIVRGESG